MREIGRHSAQVKALRRQIRRRPEGRVIVDGARLVGDLVRWQVPIHDLYLNRTVAADEASEALIAPARRAFVLDDEVFASVAPTRSPQGVLAVAEEPRWPRWTGERGCGVWLDGLQDPGNVGAVVRSAAGLGAACVLLGPGCADPWTPVAVRGSAGAVFRVPLEREVTASRAAERVQRHRGQAWLADGAGRALAAWSPGDPLLLMLGAEGRGVSSQAQAVADDAVAIPLEREVESLNVAVAAGILLAAIRR